MGFLIRPFVLFVRWAFFTKKERRLAEEKDDLKAKSAFLSDENSKLTKALQKLKSSEEDLLSQKTKLQNEIAMLKDEVAILNNRVHIMNLGYRYNRELVITILGTTNGVNDGGTGIDGLDDAGVPGAG